MDLFCRIDGSQKNTPPSCPNLVFAQGEVPEEAPEKDFTAQETEDNFDDDDEEEGLLDYDDADFY